MQHSHKKRKLVFIIALILTVQAICLCCISAVSAQRTTVKAAQTNPAAVGGEPYVSYLNEKVYTANHNRARWLYELMSATDESVALDRNDYPALYAEAQRRGIIGSYSADDLHLSLTREFVGFTLCRAMHYPIRTVGYLADISFTEYYMDNMAYYGYFLPDINLMMHPDAEVTAEEYENLLAQLKYYRLLHGKRVLSFGDSIMFGTGNDGEGISDILSEKFEMFCVNYAVPGATMGTSGKRSHIPDQLRSAVKAGEKADIILINGATNDMFATVLGAMTEGFDVSKANEKTFTGGFETLMSLIKAYYPDTPVVYIRCHNMNLVDTAIEEKYGERGLAAARKWGADTVDLYTESGLNTEDDVQRNRFTYLSPSRDYQCDGVHPNAVGYAKYYLPLITEAVADHFLKETEDDKALYRRSVL